MDNPYKDNDIAIIGISGRFPEADDLEQFWNNLIYSKESIREFPESRKEELKDFIDNISEKKFIKSGYLNNVSLFEPEIFSLNHEESKYIDPQHRLLLELVEEAILDSGYNPENLANHNMGVFVAGNAVNYTDRLCSYSPMSFSNSVLSSNAGRIAYVYNFHGPVLALDTACSSSLVAVHYACQSLKLGECTMAIAGGSKISLVPTEADRMNYNPVASKNHQVRAFDKDANGTVGGEGGGIVILKLLKNALEDGDNIHVIIKGSAINSDGRWSNGMSAPSEKGQADVIIRAIEDARIDPLTISYIETHGTGTELGDPIEVAGIKRALEKYGYPPQSIPITSVKPNIGHLDAAAGIAGIIKTVLALKNRKIPPSINFAEPNPLIKFESTPVYVNDRLADWNSDSVRRAAVTSLGLIGTNCNVILEEAVGLSSGQGKDEKNVVVISARTRKSLRGIIDKLREKLVDSLAKNPDISLNDIAYTLNNGRRSFQNKYVFMAENTTDLVEKLYEFSEEMICTRNKKFEITPIFIIPDLNNIDITMADELCQKEPIYKRSFDQCMETLNSTNELDEIRQKYLAHIFAYTELLKSYSIKPKAVLGFGMGDIVGDLIREKISLQQTIKGIKNHNLEKIDIPVDKLGVMVEKIVGTGINTFILIWPQNELLQKFDKVLTGKESICFGLNQGVVSFYSGIIDLIKRGLEVNWSEVYEGQCRKRLSLPGYVFDRKTYLLPVEKKGLYPASNTLETKSLYTEVDTNLLHKLVWVKEELRPKQEEKEYYNSLNENKGENGKNISGVWLIVCDNLGIGTILSKKMNSEGAKVIKVFPDEGFKKIDDASYQINLADIDNYHQLIKNIWDADQKLTGVINLFNCERPIEYLNIRTSREYCNTEFDLNKGYYSTLYLTQALLSKYENLKLYHITTNAHQVLEDDSLINPAKRMTWTLNKVINQEITHYSSYCIDFDLTDSSPEEICQQIMNEITYNSEQILEIAYRKNERFIQSYNSLKEILNNDSVVKKDGVYLITGGTGGIGLEICKYFAFNKKVNLILINRKPLSEKNPIDMEYKLQVVKELQKNGTVVEMVYGDVSNYQQMKEIISQIKRTYGRIDGVVHTAGISGGRPRIPSINKDDAENVFAPKVYGTLILSDLLRDQFLDFFVTCSSLSSQVGGFGFGIYATANSFLDSFCAQQRQLGKKYIAINWGNWGEVGAGIAASAGKDYAYASGLSKLTNTEGISTFAVIVQNNLDNYSVNRLSDKLAKLYESFSFFKLQRMSQKIEEESSNTLDDKSIKKNLYSMINDLYVGDDLDLTDKILELELDSIDVMQFVTKIKKAYNVTVPLNLLFNDITVEEVIEKIKSLISGEPEDQIFIAKQPEKEFYPVSTSQNRLYLISQLDEESTAYNLNIFWILEGNVNPTRIEKVVRELIKRHESLRTSFELVEGKVVQKVHQDVEFKVEFYDVREEELKDISKEFIKPFDLSKAPLIKIGLAKVANRYLLMMDLHHIIFDGVSQNILFKEFFALYKGEYLPETKLQYRDFAVWQHQLLNSERIKSQKEFWLETFSGKIPRLNMPTDYPRPKVLNFKGDKLKFSVDEELTERLNKLVKAKGVTMFMLLLAAYNVLIGKYANQEDIIVGSPITGRHYPDLENIIGIFINTLPLRNHPLKSKTFSEFLADVKENTLKAYDNQDYPLEMIVDDLDLIHDPGRNPLFDIEFNLNTQRREDDFKDIQIDGLSFKLYQREYSTARFDLSLTGVELGGKIELDFEYRTALFKKETIDQLAKDYLKILLTIVNEPGIKIHDIKLAEELDELETGQFADVGFDF